MRQYLPDFAYSRPKSLAQAIEFLNSNRARKVFLVAGGTDLLVAMRTKNLNPDCVVSLTNLSKGLSTIVFDSRTRKLKIGALATIHSLETNRLVTEKFPLLSEAASQLGDYQIRNRATIGGNICNASPAADTVPPLMVLDSHLAIVSWGRPHERRIDQFFVGPGKTVLSPRDILTGVVITEPRKPWGGSFLKVSRGSEGCSIVNVASFVRIEEGKIAEIRVALGSVAPTPVRAFHVENELAGTSVSEGLPDSIQSVEEDIAPISDVRAEAGYRMHLSKVLVARSLKISVRRALES